MAVLDVVTGHSGLTRAIGRPCLLLPLAHRTCPPPHSCRSLPSASATQTRGSACPAVSDGHHAFPLLLIRTTVMFRVALLKLTLNCLPYREVLYASHAMLPEICFARCQFECCLSALVGPHTYPVSGCALRWMKHETYYIGRVTMLNLSYLLSKRISWFCTKSCPVFRLRITGHETT